MNMSKFAAADFRNILSSGTTVPSSTYDIFDNCNWVDTRWQQYSTHLYKDSTQNNTMKQNTENIPNNKNT